MTRNGETSDRQEKGAKIPGKEALRAPLPKRFYTSVAVAERGGSFAVLLDGRTIRTPAKRELVVPVQDLAAAIAAEWEAQGEHVDPASMPLTRLVNSALDAVAERSREVADDIVAFAGSDLLCYRAETPDALVRRQDEAWNPILAWARRDLGADLVLRAGLMPIDQPPEALDAVRRSLTGIDSLSLAALHVLTTIGGSALVAIAHWRGHLSLEDAWQATSVDEAWQREQWGRDAEAEAYTAQRRAEFEAASRCLSYLRSRR
ncbi:ATP12 family protein [Hyphomicrobium sp.]|uniref:ATP12 family chaperone protein n=1 Tax=Hyphomicrobium sp. TaxID=82 RepID=UPI0025C120E2|nr:ATP12 family protein [Hyphomicrobium sp.]MCC7251849.1 ATPase [Hyphomicrobium sp.]